MTDRMAAHERNKKVLRTVTTIALTVAAFAAMATLVLPDPVLLTVGIASIVLAIWGIYIDSGEDDMSSEGCVLLALGSALLFGLIFRITEGDIAAHTFCTVCIVFFAGLSLIPYMREVWAEKPATKQIKRLPYKRWRDDLRQVATEGEPDERLAALLRLRMPDDEDVLREGLATLPKYEAYDLAYGWPHEHEFARVSSKEEGDGEGNGDTTIVTKVSRCDCGVVKTERCRRRKVTVTGDGICPNCGGKVEDRQEDIWMGGHYTYEILYTCQDCGREDTVDFSGSYTKNEDETLEVTYGRDGDDGQTTEA